MYTIATLVDETTFTTNGEEMGYGLNPDYYDDDGWEPMEFTYQNTSFAIKEILFNRDTASFPNGMVVQSDGTLTYEAITTLTCCVCGREFYANDVGKEMLLPISSYGGFSGCDTSCLIEDKFCSDLAILLREGGNTVFGDIDEGENIADSTELFVADEITSTSLPEADEQDEIEILSMSMPDVQLQDEDIISNEDDLVIDSSIISMSMSEVQLPVTLPSSTTSPESTAAPVDVDIMSTSIPDPEDNTIGTTAANSVAAPGSTAQAVIGTTSTASTGAPESTYVPSDVDTTFMSMPIFFEETATGTTESYQSMPMILEELSDDHYSSISMSMKSPAVDYIPPIEEPVQERYAYFYNMSSYSVCAL